MHIPDNYLSPATCAAMGALMVPIWAIAAKKVKSSVEKSKIPLLGICAAFSFLIMMFNIPLPGGTTGHAVGAAIIAALLGPWAACISVSVALLIQALLFGDGGILAFGANCFNMAFVMPFLSYFVFKFFKDRSKGPTMELVGLGAGAYLGINFAALMAAIEFGLQPLLSRDAAGLPLFCPYPLAVSIPAMMIPHLLVAGFVEVVFTLGIFAFITKVSPGIIYEGGRKKINAIYAFLIALVCLSPLGLLATGTAWGEWGADEIVHIGAGGSVLGFTPSGMEKGFSFAAPAPDYAFAGLPEWASYMISAVAGVAILVIVFKLASLAKRGTKATA